MKPNEPITEKELRNYSYGGVLNIVFTLNVEDSSGNSYEKTISTSLGLPIKQDTSE